ncbi:MAG: hypothetical protein ACREBJ_00070 [Nitrosotalea sp.]
MGFPYDRSSDPKAAISYGRDFNFFKNVTPGSSTPGVFAADCDVVITFSTYNVTFWMGSSLGAGTMQYSFNGNTVHGTIDSAGTTAPAFLEFDNRVVSKIWFSGTGVVRVEAWSIR